MNEQNKLNLNNLRLVVSAVRKNQYPEGTMPELAFAGRSNVGKSSLINRLLNRKSFARTSSVPGKTATINFYEVDGRLLLVDLPGYGYAKRSKAEIRKWGGMMDEYFMSRENLSAVVLLIDSRHAPTKDDVLMADFVRQVELPLIVAATKLDKLKAGEVPSSLARICKNLSLDASEPLIPFSAEKGTGRGELWEIIEAVMEAEESELSQEDE